MQIIVSMYETLKYEQHGSSLSDLPDEILLYVLSLLDINEIHHFSQVILGNYANVASCNILIY